MTSFGAGLDVQMILLADWSGWPKGIEFRDNLARELGLDADTAARRIAATLDSTRSPSSAVMTRWTLRGLAPATASTRTNRSMAGGSLFKFPPEIPARLRRRSGRS